MSDHNCNFVLTLKNICKDPRQKQLLFKYIQDVCENPILDFEFTLIDNNQLKTFKEVKSKLTKFIQFQNIII